MFRRVIGSLLAGTLACAGARAAAQTSPAAAGPATSSASVVYVALGEDVSSKTRKRGDLFAIRLAAPATIDGKLAPAGTPGIGQVVDAASSGPLGRPAKLLLAARYLDFDGRRVALHAFRIGAAGKDESNSILVASFIPYVGIFAGFAHGGEIVIPAGTLGQAKFATIGLPPVSEKSTSTEAMKGD